MGKSSGRALNYFTEGHEWVLEGVLGNLEWAMGLGDWFLEGWHSLSPALPPRAPAWDVYCQLWIFVDSGFYVSA